MLANIVKNLAWAVLIFSTAFAWDIDHFEVTAYPEEVTIWEAVDLTIEAFDKDNNIKTDYVWTVLIFSESDGEAIFPNAIEDSSYTFKASDQGHIKFENGVRFQNKWTQDIHVYDLEDDNNSVVWLAEVMVKEKTKIKNIEISILSPENGLTIWADEITVSWKTNKNHQVKIVLNGKEDILTTSNSDWIYEKKISDIPKWKNVFKAFVLDSSNQVVWESKKVQITSDSSLPIFDKISISPDTKLQTVSDVSIKVYASPWLDSVELILNDTILKLNEAKKWVYDVNTVTPSTIWNFPIDLILKDDIGHKVKIDAVETLIISKNTNPPKVGTKDECPDWDYSWDVFDWKCWEKPNPPLNAALDLEIRNLKLVALKTKSILTWDKLNDATEYQVYKKLDWGQVELIDTVTDPIYEVEMIWDEIKYDFFAIKAIWKREFIDTENKNKVIEKKIPWDLSDAIKIQTGPKEILLVILALILGFGVFSIRKKKI